jgi:hypothetical protein
MTIKQADQETSIYDTLKAAGAVMDNHESDLYVKAAPGIPEILSRSGLSYSTFVSHTDDALWYEVPFAYAPWWLKRRLLCGCVAGGTVEECVPCGEHRVK